MPRHRRQESQLGIKIVMVFVGILIIKILTEEEHSDLASDKIKVFTVATERTDGYLRYIHSARVHNIAVSNLGLNQQWTGGGIKINLLRQAIEPMKNTQDMIIIFTDSYDVIITTSLKEIVEKFKASGAKLLFSAEKYCWPDASLETAYPVTEAKESRFLNSGAFIGYAPQVYALLSDPVDDTEDDQLYYTKIFLDEARREELGFKLDTQSTVFQNLHGAKDDVKLKVDLESNQGVLHNLNFLTQPSIVHGNGLSKVDLNAYGNYLTKAFNDIQLDEKNLPVISLALMVTHPVPFFDMFLNKISMINYPKAKLHLFVFNNVELHDDATKAFLKKYKTEYASAKLVLSTDGLSERLGRELALEQAKKRKSGYIFFVDAVAQIDDKETLRKLLKNNKQFVAPIFSVFNKAESNFWGTVSDDGNKMLSPDHLNITKGDLRGMWNVPFVSTIYLIKSTAFDVISYEHSRFDPDMAMCDSLRNAGVFMYATNANLYGHLINATSFNTTVARPDFYTLLSNEYYWTQKYIHPEYEEQLNENYPVPEPCQDVFWFKIVTEAFCNDLVAIMENFGQWSDGSNNDSRLEGGYEAVPTRDVHMKQVGLHEMWLAFLDMFVQPLEENVFGGLELDVSGTDLNFVVRYRPDEQPSLRPHHDRSIYTINIALNNVGVDYTGGGCRFLRYNCSVTNTKKGWMLMHPGRLTHQHEGLPVTSGTRLIMISFVNDFD